MNPAIISECKEPWLFWWALVPTDEKKALKRKYFPDSAPAFPTWLLEDEIRQAWEIEQPEPLCDLDWLDLAHRTIDYPKIVLSNTKQEREIWRQVYRIASEKI